MRPRSLVRATDIDVLAPDREVRREHDHLIVTSPSNPTFYWGNLLIYDAAPGPGDRDRWLADFAAALPHCQHRTFAWDETDGTVGAASSEFSDFALEHTVGLVATPTDLHPHARAATDVEIVTLDPAGDDRLWQAVVDLWVAQTEADPEPTPPRYRDFAENRLAELRAHARAGRGAWFIARRNGELAGSCGVVVTGPRARFQAVDVAVAHRGHGVASRLVHDAGVLAAARWPVRHLVIAADAEYHALGIYESLGFARVERVSGICRWPATER